MDLTTVAWRKSSFSNPSSNDCVEVANTPGTSAIRDTKHRDHNALLFGSPEWHAFIEAVKRDAAM